MTYSSAEVVYNIRDALCGLPGNKIGWSTAEAAAGHLPTTRACDWRELMESIRPGANADLRSGGIREVASFSAPTSSLRQPARDNSLP